MRSPWMKSSIIWTQIGMQSIKCCTMRVVRSRVVCRPAVLRSARRSPCSAPRGKILTDSATYNSGVAVKSNRFERWLQNIHQTQDKEISCSECFDLVAHFVEVELAGAPTRMPQLKQHLDQCAACREEYETLRDLQLLENKGELPSADDLQDKLDSLN